MATTLFGIRNCDTMKKARRWLDMHGVSYAFHDYKAAGIGPEVLADWARKVGWETFLNRSGLTFRKLPEGARADITADKALRLMREHPSMIKRPVLDTGSQIIVGFKPEIYAKLF